LVFLLWGSIRKSQQKTARAEKKAVAAVMIGEADEQKITSAAAVLDAPVAAEAEAAAETAEAAEAAAAERAPSGNASVALKAVVTNATANKARSATGSMTSELSGIEKGDDATTVEKRASSLSTKKVAIEAVAETNTDEEKAAEELKGAEELKEADEKAAQGDTKKTFVERIAPLAKKITEYIQDHQDDSAQEERWRTTMKRDMSKSFRLQVEAAKKQSELVDSRFDRQREEIMNKVETEVQSMQLRFDDVHAKLDETIQLIRNLANPWPR